MNDERGGGQSGSVESSFSFETDEDVQMEKDIDANLKYFK